MGERCGTGRCRVRDGKTEQEGGAAELGFFSMGEGVGSTFKQEKGLKMEKGRLQGGSCLRKGLSFAKGVLTFRVRVAIRD